MWSIRVNKRMRRIKLHYFLYMGGVAGVQGFWPTIAKQQGYSPMIVGFLYTYLSILSLIAKSICGIIVDKFAVKRTMFLTCVLSCGLSAFALSFINRLPIETAVNLSCGTATTELNICSNDDNLQLSQCDDGLSKHLKNNVDLIKCQLYCQPNKWFREEVCKSWSLTDYCTTSADKTFEINALVDYLNVSLSINITDQIKGNIVYQVKLVKTENSHVLLPVCQRFVTTRCNITCPDDGSIIELATVSKFKGSIFSVHQFWGFAIVLTIFWISQAITWGLQDPICFDLLGDKPEDFGKQRCWGSISWGIFSIFSGALVDNFSDGSLYKNYTPIYYLCLIILLCDVALASKINVTETVGSKNTFSDVLKLLTNLNVVIFFIWIIMLGIYTSMPWNYLSWYMEDITSKYHIDKQPWIKTLQGLAVGIQCILGEVPFLFFSGWIIKRIGYCYCMSLGLFVFFVRFYLYSIITNPIWILPVELTNGITYGLCHAVLLAYARIITPPNSVTTVIGLAGALFEGVGTSMGGYMGGYLYESYGGAWTFKLFSYSSLFMCIIHVILMKLSKSNKY